MAFKYEEVRAEVRKHGWELISDKYVNLKTQMEFKCDKGHLVETTFEKFRRNQNCPVCKNSYTDGLANTIPADIIQRAKSGVKILAFDQATNDTGMAFFVDGQLIYYGMKSAKGSEPAKRINELKKWVRYLINELKPHLVAFEDIQLQGGNAKVYGTLAKMLGVMEDLMVEMNQQYEIIHSQEWKAALKIPVFGSSRAAQKQMAQEIIKKRFNLTVSQDVCDAICIGFRALSKRIIPQTKSFALTFDE